MDFNEINKQLKKLNSTCSVSEACDLIATLVSSLGINNIKPEELLIHPSIQREISRFVKAPGFRNQAAAYEIHHDSNPPIDLKLFWLHKTTKANLSWIVALTPNYEDSPENNPNANIGIDFVLSEECDRLFIILSKNLKLRVLELHESLSHTQREIFENWTTFANQLDTNSNTYKDQLQQHLWKSFDFEPTNRKFYQELVTQFDHLVNHLKKEISEEEAKMFAVRFIGRTLFLWFLRKKEFINKDKNYFEVSGSSDQTEYYRTKLEPLFFEVLNTESRARSYDDKITPFLNGGLFEPIETDFYKNEKLTFPDGFFTQFYALLNHYNFTVDEGTSEYEHVAVDPEMLGRVFENLLASINEETGKQARKAKGAFYTPREIVDYMCQQSLVEYLKTKLPETTNRDRRIEELVTMNESEFREQDHNKRRDWKKDLGKEDILKALSEIRVLDPAVGSGAFLMGMLTLLVKVYSRIDTAREKDLSKLKREILSQSLYGVDIDQMAIQISRLRAWLSMLVDMGNLKKVEPLPNLDFKFVCANTLIPLDDGQNALFDSDVNLKEKLIELRDQYYRATRKTEKSKIRKEYLQNIQTGDLFASEREKQLKDYDPFDPLNSSSFYDPSLMHGVESFDVVIGNPPYFVYQGSNKAEIEKIREIPTFATAFGGKLNAYKLFIALSPSLLIHGGIGCLIFQNSFLADNSAKKLRKYYLSEKTIIQIDSFPERDNPNKRVFEGVKMSVCISLFKNEINNNTPFRLRVWNSKEMTDGYEIYYKPSEIIEMDPVGASIPSIRPEEKELLIKIYEKGSGDIIQCFEGELNMTFHKKYFNDDKQNPKILKGAAIQRYTLTDNLSQGKVEYLNENEYLKDFVRSKKSQHHRNPRIAMQGITGVDDRRRLIMSIIPKDNYCANSCNYILINDKSFSLESILGLMNSTLFNWIYKKTSTNSNVNCYEIENLPIIEKKDDKRGLYNNIEDLVKTIISNTKKQIDNTSNFEYEIDELVMDLYELTEEEKEIVRKS